MRFQSLMPSLGTPLPDFTAADSAGRRYAADFTGGRGILVAFICNHCPFVMHIADRFVAVANAAVAQGVRVVAISSNDVDAFSEDGPEPVARFASERGFGFPYLYDADQQMGQSPHQTGGLRSRIFSLEGVLREEVEVHGPPDLGSVVAVRRR